MDIESGIVKKTKQNDVLNNEQKTYYNFFWFLAFCGYLCAIAVLVYYVYSFCLVVRSFQNSIEPLIDLPYLAKLIYDNGKEVGFGCTAFLINNLTLLTAAHCLVLDKNVSITAVHIGGTREKNYDDMLKISGDQLNFKSDYNLNNGDFAVINLKAPIISTDAVRPITLAPRFSKLPKTLKFSKWLNDDVSRMDAVQFNVSVIDHDECIRRYQTVNRTVDFYGKHNKRGRSIVFCTDGEFIEAGNSGTPLIAINEEGYAFGLLSIGPTESFSLPNVFVDLRAFMDQIDGNNEY